MTLRGLQEVGLNDWPSWYRRSNPGYFASEISRPGPPARLGRARAKEYASVGSNGGACCDNLHTSIPTRGERPQARVAVRDRVTGEILKREELSEQIIASLRGMSQEGKFVDGEKRGFNGGTAMIERAAAMDAKNWEDESEEVGDDDEDGSEEDEVETVKAQLVDV